MALNLSSRHELVRQSEIRNMSVECDRMGGINLSQGISDLAVPKCVMMAAQKAIEGGYNSYTHFSGLEELRKAIAEKQKKYTGMDIDPENEIVVSAGSTGAFYCACLALLNPGDEVILFEPYYGYHKTTLVAAGAVPVYVRLSPPEWTFTDESLESVVSGKTRGILINTPANPSGKVFSKEELDRIAEFASNYDLFVFTDEIYEHFLYDGKEHIAPATIPGMRERTITISGLSKTFSITGWRIGYSICDPKWSRSIGYFNDLIYVCAPSPLQMGVAKGLIDLDKDFYQHISQQFQRKRDMVCNSLREANLNPFVPEGAYYILADISRIPGKSSNERCLYILREIGVASVPGSAFYHDKSGEKLARFCFAKEDYVLSEACTRLKSLK